MKVQIFKEHTHLFAPSINVIIKVDIKGLTSTSNLPKAIRTAVEQNEILSCKIEIDSNGNAYYVKQEEPNYTISIMDGDWLKLALIQENIPFDLANGELIRFFILEQDDITQLLIVAHHLAGDGLSFAYFVEDIMNTLETKQPPAFKPVKLFRASDLPDNSKLNPITKLMVRYANQKWEKTGSVFTFEDYFKMVEEYSCNHKTEVVCKSISNHTYMNLLQQAKQHNLSVNSIITTAFLQADLANHDIGITLNVRPKGFTGMGNYATGITITHRYNEKKNFFENAKAVHAFVNKKRNNNQSKYFLTQFMGSLSPTLIDAAYFSTFGNYQNKIAKQVASMFGYSNAPNGTTISNLTKLPIESSFGDYQISNFVCVPPLVANTNRIIGIATLHDTMTITLHIEQNENAAVHKSVFHSTISILENLQ